MAKSNAVSPDYNSPEIDIRQFLTEQGGGALMRLAGYIPHKTSKKLPNSPMIRERNGVRDVDGHRFEVEYVEPNGIRLYDGCNIPF